MPEVVIDHGMEDLDDMMIFPITDLDNNNEGYDEYGNMHDHGDGLLDGNNKSFKPSMTLRQRRYSQLGIGNGPLLKLNVSLEPSAPQSIQEVIRRPFNARHMWKKSLRLIRGLKDPWEKFNIHSLSAEKAIRHRYNALKKKWRTDDITIKMEPEPFNHGAMRSCFRLKKTSSFARKNADWQQASNYVAKKYMQTVEKDVYFADVKLQMDAKLWGEEYNRHNPPKKVDIFQMCIIELVDRPDKPLYHLEHFIEGNYIKYNSNSGFVEDCLRLTPQAFSHFTFERSGHQLIVVDIQGVGDLWTDPQIHTGKGDEYGDGNLGMKGMALFFHSHVCNDICDTLMLTKFDLSSSEEKGLEKFIKMQTDAVTRCRGVEEMVVCASPTEQIDLTEFLSQSQFRARSRTFSGGSNLSSDHSMDENMNSPRRRAMNIYGASPPMRRRVAFGPIVAASPPVRKRVGFDIPAFSPRSSPRSTPRGTPRGTPPSRLISLEDDPMVGSPIPTPSPMCISPVKHRRVRFTSESDDSASGTLTELTEHEINLRNLQENKRLGDSTLGYIHHEMAKYHEMGRFSPPESTDMDMEAALYHEQMAADLGIKEAILTMAQLYLGMQHDVLVNVVVDNSEENINKGVDYMLYAAETGDRCAMVFMAKAFETGQGLGTNRPWRVRSYEEAVHWFEQAVNTTDADESGEFDATMQDPTYQLKAKMAELYLEGGYHLTADPSYSGDLYNEAAEEAMAAMKGRLANKYYALAEEAYAQVEEE